MKYEVLNDKRNDPMERKEFTLQFNHTRNATVSKAMVQKSVSDSEKVPATHVLVDKVMTKKGTTTSIVNVEVYNKPVTEDLTGSAEPQQEEKTEEAPKEETKEKQEETSEEPSEEKEESE